MTPEERAEQCADIGAEFGVSGDGDRALKAAIVASIRAAVAEERERCAKIAEAVGGRYCHEAGSVATAVERIAEAIRAQ